MTDNRDFRAAQGRGYNWWVGWIDTLDILVYGVVRARNKYWTCYEYILSGVKVTSHCSIHDYTLVATLIHATSFLPDVVKSKSVNHRQSLISHLLGETVRAHTCKIYYMWSVSWELWIWPPIQDAGTVSWTISTALANCHKSVSQERNSSKDGRNQLSISASSFCDLVRI